MRTQKQSVANCTAAKPDLVLATRGCYCQQYQSQFFPVISASRENHIKFNDCPVGIPKQLSFTLTNHSTTDPVRFTWNPPPEITFSPCTGHLLPGCAKDINITLTSSKPKAFKTQNIPCKVTKIKLGEAQDKVMISK